MNTAETVAVIITLGVLGLTGLLILASAQEWMNLSLAASLKFVPASKRQPRTAVEVINVIPGTVEPPEPVAAIRRTG